MTSFSAFISALSQNAHSILSPSISKKDFCLLDLSITNSKLKEIDVSSSETLGKYINNYILSQNAQSAFGGYIEERGIYRRSDYFNQENPETERNIHLGLDVWVDAETPIYAPLDGSIHSFKNNTNFGDYGPTLILKHHINEVTFYTLYGHLSEASIYGLKVGEYVKQGAQIATLGTAAVNGDYPPHLHFQIIKDIQHYKGDYPGVSNRRDLDFYKANCPDPNLLLGLGEQKKS